MPTFNFPSPAAVDDTYTENGVTYTYDGVAWAFSGPSTTSALYVKKTGDSMSGPLVLPILPATPDELGNKKYIDETIATMALYQGIYQVTLNQPDLNVPPNAPLNGYSWVAQTADPNVPEMALAGIPGIGGTMIAALDTLRWNDALFVYEHIKGAVGISQMTIQDTPPTGGFAGQTWWDSDSGKMYCYFDDGTSSQWVQMSGGGGGTNVVPVSDVPPTNPTKGMLWFNSADASLYIYWNDGTSWQWTEVSA